MKEMVSVPSRGILFPNYDVPVDDNGFRIIVSVPSRGILFPNNMNRTLCGKFDVVSVPSRGILFPNGELLSWFDSMTSQFPSPLGVSYFQISSC